MVTSLSAPAFHRTRAECLHVFAKTRVRLSASVYRYRICKGLSCGKGLATHRRVDSIEGTQFMDIRNAANGDRIAQILNLALRIDERRPQGKARAVWIARSCEVDPVARHLLSQPPICRGPVP